MAAHAREGREFSSRPASLSRQARLNDTHRLNDNGLTPSLPRRRGKAPTCAHNCLMYDTSINRRHWGARCADMRLTYFTDYAFRVLIYLAVQPDRRCTIREISTAYDISRAHLMKVVNLLTREGLVIAQRGPNGGLVLAVPPEQLRLGDVVRKTEDDLGPVECFRPENQCRLTPACALAPVLARALGAFLEELDQHTLADLVRQPAPVMKVLELRTSN